MSSISSKRLGQAPEEGIKAPCVAATTGNITLSGLPVVDTVQTVAGNRVLVIFQTDASENGIYVAASGLWSRANDWNQANDIINGQLVTDANRTDVYSASFTGAMTVGTTDVTFSIAITSVSTTFVEDPQTLSAGQTTVTFTLIDATASSFYIGSLGVDRGRLVKGVDYTVTSALIIELTNSYPAGTKCIGIYGDYGAEISPTNGVIKADSIADAIADSNLLDGSAINVKEITNGDGESSMWDAVLASTVTTNGDNIRQCIGVPILALVRRIYKEKPASEMFRRSLVHNLSFRDTAYNFLLSTYSYTQIYPQSVAIDETEREIFVQRGVAGGGNSWSWIWVYDLDTAAFKTVFTFATSLWESLVIRVVGSTRYLYANDKSDNVIRGNITTLPSNYSTLATADTYAVEAFTHMTWDGNYFYVTSHQQRHQDSRRHHFKVFDGDFTQTGEATWPISVLGSFQDYLEYLPKSQDITFHKGRIYIGTGTVYHPGDDDGEISLFSGIQSILPDGTNVLQALCRPDEALAKMEEVVGHTMTLLENEGIYGGGENLYALWVTLDSAEWVLDNNQGIAITLELSDKPDRIDFSDAATGIPKPYNNLAFSNECWHDGQPLPNPILLTDLTTFQEIIDMMNELQMSFYTYGGVGQSLTDVNAAAVPVDGNLIEVTNINGASFVFKVTGASIQRQYWVAGGGSSQVIRNITYT